MNRTDPPANVVQPGSFLTLHYRLSGANGADLVNTFGAQPATLSLGEGQLSPALEARLLGLREGAHAVFELPAGTAFGTRSVALLQRVPHDVLRAAGQTEDIACGDVLQFPEPEGLGRCGGVVREVGADGVLFDFNHPLAGRAVRFEVHVLGVL